MAMADRHSMERRDRALCGTMSTHLPSDADPAPSLMRRGACPSLATPMMTGDGLLVRLRPARPGFTFGQFRSLCPRRRETCGNGILEITARGNLQIRG